MTHSSALRSGPVAAVDLRPKRSGPTARSRYPWLGDDEHAIHCGLLGRMAATNRLVRGESFHDRAARAGLTTGQLAMAERGLMMSQETAGKLLAVCGFHRAPFTRKYLEPALGSLERFGLRSADDEARAAMIARAKASMTQQREVVG